jgi:hypothetical protein
MVFASGRRIKKEIRHLENSIDKTQASIYMNEDIEKMPEPVQRYFRYVLKDGQKLINIARIRQSGFIKLKENSKWVPLKAVQYFNGQKPVFIWVASAKSSPFFWINAVDRYSGSGASMTVRLFSLFPVINATGEEMKVSSLIRYVSELPWLPTSLLPSDYLSWEAINKNSAAVVIRYRNISMKVIFNFNEDGEISSVESDERYMFANGKYNAEKWKGYFKNYKEFSGIKVPTEVEAEWKLKKRAHKYIRLKIDDIKYD